MSLYEEIKESISGVDTGYADNIRLLLKALELKCAEPHVQAYPSHDPDYWLTKARESLCQE